MFIALERYASACSLRWFEYMEKFVLSVFDSEVHFLIALVTEVIVTRGERRRGCKCLNFVESESKGL